MPSIPEDKLRIGRALLAGGPVTQETLQAQLDRAGKAQSVLGKALLQAGMPKEEDIIYTLLSRLRIPRINAKSTKIHLETVRLIPEEVALRQRLLALDEMGNVLVVVTLDAGNEAGMAEVRAATGHQVFPIQADTKTCTEQEFEAIIRDYYQRLRESGLAPVAPLQMAGSVAVASSAGGDGGPVRAIPADPAHEDAFWRRFMTSGPVPAAEALM